MIPSEPRMSVASAEIAGTVYKEIEAFSTRLTALSQNDHTVSNDEKGSEDGVEVAHLECKRHRRWIKERGCRGGRESKRRRDEVET